jgi:hypothetical protein
MMVVMVVSRRLGQVIFLTSSRTSLKNLTGLTFAILFDSDRADCGSLPISPTGAVARNAGKLETLQDRRKPHTPAVAQSLTDETTRGPICGDTIAADVRNRAASDTAT